MGEDDSRERRLLALDHGSQLEVPEVRLQRGREIHIRFTAKVEPVSGERADFAETRQHARFWPF
jgi:hypothetical protein